MNHGGWSGLTQSYVVDRPKRTSKPKSAEPPRSRRHLFVPDTQVRPGVPTDHIGWIGQALVHYRPDVIVIGGDHWDFPSLNSHEVPGSAELEGRRFQTDVEAGNLAFKQLCEPMEKAQAKDKTWQPRKIFLCGNHEDRADRVAQSDPKWLGHVGSHACNVRDFEWHPFLERVLVDGVLYSHYFSNTHSSRPIGGSIDNRLNKICCTFACGHEQGFRYGTRITAAGKTIHGIVAGSAYVHRENYRGNQGQAHFRGIVVLNEVRDGDFSIMPVSLDFLCRKYEHQTLQDYMALKYPDQDWGHLI